jgi:hypothetical protein
MSASPNPPLWAETLLRAMVRSVDFETVSGDLMETYRDSIYPARGELRADLWYAKQLLGFVSPSIPVLAILFSAQYIARTALDWFVPVMDFHARATVSTALGVGILLAAGSWAAWRSDSFLAGTVAGAATAGLASLLSIAGAATMLTIWHDPQTVAAIRGSGGIEEVFSLPLTMLLPGAMLGAVGGAASKGIRAFVE